MLRISRQIHNEASAVLYRENIFKPEINFYDGEKGQPRGFLHHIPYFSRSRLQTIEKYVITIELDSPKAFQFVRGAVRRTCAFLADIEPKELHLDVHLKIFPDVGSYAVLAPSGGLRNVHVVNFRESKARRDYYEEKEDIFDSNSHKLPPTSNLAEYGGRLAVIMKGATPLDDLPKMCDALHGFAGHITDLRARFNAAEAAVDAGLVEEFKSIREDLLAKAEVYMADAKARLYDHDRKEYSDGGRIW